MIATRAAGMIRRAEREIRGLIGESASAGDYELASRLSGIARRLASLAEETSGAREPPNTDDGSTIAPTTATAKSRKGPPGSDYPRFERSRDSLVKVGWSKKGRSEYFHKAPKTGVDAVARRIMEVGKSGRVFTTEDLLPVKLGSGEALPEYQAYVCLAWLRSIRAIEQHGREGYSSCVDDTLTTVNNMWVTLPASRR